MSLEVCDEKHGPDEILTGTLCTPKTEAVNYVHIPEKEFNDLHAWFKVINCMLV